MPLYTNREEQLRLLSCYQVLMFLSVSSHYCSDSFSILINNSDSLSIFITHFFSLSKEAFSWSIIPSYATKHAELFQQLLFLFLIYSIRSSFG
eukprot:g30060.t1